MLAKKARQSGLLRVAQVRCVWRLVLPLLDAGYQVDVRVLDAVFYAVPQTRGVRCCVPPVATMRVFYDVPQTRGVRCYACQRIRVR